MIVVCDVQSNAKVEEDSCRWWSSFSVFKIISRVRFLRFFKLRAALELCITCFLNCIVQNSYWSVILNPAGLFHVHSVSAVGAFTVSQPTSSILVRQIWISCSYYDAFSTVQLSSPKFNLACSYWSHMFLWTFPLMTRTISTFVISPACIMS